LLLLSTDYISRIHYVSSSRCRLLRHLRFCLLVFIFGPSFLPPFLALRSFFHDACRQTSPLRFTIPRKPDLLICHMLTTKVWRILRTLVLWRNVFCVYLFFFFRAQLYESRLFLAFFYYPGKKKIFLPVLHFANDRRKNAIDHRRLFTPRIPDTVRYFSLINFLKSDICSLGQKYWVPH